MCKSSLPCHSWLTTGRCRYGEDKCIFQHKIVELNPLGLLKALQKLIVKDRCCESQPRPPVNDVADPRLRSMEKQTKQMAKQLEKLKQAVNKTMAYVPYKSAEPVPTKKPDTVGYNPEITHALETELDKLLRSEYHDEYEGNTSSAGVEVSGEEAPLAKDAPPSGPSAAWRQEDELSSDVKEHWVDTDDRHELLVHASANMYDGFYDFDNCEAVHGVSVDELMVGVLQDYKEDVLRDPVGGLDGYPWTAHLLRLSFIARGIPLD